MWNSFPWEDTIVVNDMIKLQSSMWYASWLRPAGDLGPSWVVFNKQIFLTLQLSQSKQWTHCVRNFINFIQLDAMRKLCVYSLKKKKKLPNKTEIVVMETSRLGGKKKALCFRNLALILSSSSLFLGRERVFCQEPRPSLLQIKARPSYMWTMANCVW